MRAVACVLVLGACTFDRPADVTFGDAAITITEGDHQTAIVDTQLPMALKVNVTDGDFLPIENFTVEFHVRDANGTVSEDAVRTDAQGNARTELTLGTHAGDQFVDVSGEGIDGNAPVFFSAVALADVPAQISAFAGDNGSATVATSLGAPLVARVEDRFGNASPAGVEVTFAIASGGGTLSSPTGTSAADGTVSTGITLGTVAGPSMVDATATGLTKATFTVIGLADAPATIERTSPATLLAEALRPSEPMIVTARDAYGNPAPGATITFTRTTGTGTIDTPTVVTDANGQAAGTIVVPTFVGTNNIVATAAFTTTMLAFTATTRNVRPAAGLNLVGKQSFAAVGDINMDGLPDLVVPTSVSSPTPFQGFTVYLNTTAPGAGTATFAATQIADTSVSSSTRVSVDDVTGDGAPDVILNSTSARIFPSTTAAGSTTPTFGTVFTANATSGVPVLADMNGDQMKDLVILGSQFLVSRRTGAMSFTNAQYFNSVDESQAFVVDMNGDGKLDVATMTSSYLYTYANTTAVGATNLTFGSEYLYVSPFYYGTLSDLDADGKPDWITSNGSSLRIFRNSTVTTTSFTQVMPDLTPGLYNPITTVDVNGDGLLDIVGSSGSYVRMYLNTSTGGTLSFVSADTQVSLNNGYRLEQADFNKDGRMDFLIDNGGTTSIILAQ